MHFTGSHGLEDAACDGSTVPIGGVRSSTRPLLVLSVQTLFLDEVLSSALI
jgi:hypothetical protein